MDKKESITLEDLKKGSDEVLRQVYEANRDKFFNYAKRYNLPKEDLVDIYQDAYIAFYDNVMNNKIKSFTSAISTYIISIGKYLIFDTLKKKSRMVTTDFDFSTLDKKTVLVQDLEIENQILTKEQKLLYRHFDSLGQRTFKFILL